MRISWLPIEVCPFLHFWKCENNWREGSIYSHQLSNFAQNEEKKFSSFCFKFPHALFFKHEKKCISTFMNCSWWILLKLGMVWTYSVPGGTSWVQTIPRFSKITTCRMNEEKYYFKHIFQMHHVFVLFKIIREFIFEPCKWRFCFTAWNFGVRATIRFILIIRCFSCRKK